MAAPLASLLAPDATRASRARPLLGVSAAGFAAVIEAAGGRAALAGATTGTLKYEHVKPATAGDSVAYISLLRARPEGAELVGEATVFFSHAYDYCFLDAVDAAEAWEQRNPRAGGRAHFFYFDLLVNSQHTAETVPFEVLRDEFGGGVRAIGHTLFLLDYKEPLSLQSAWCTFEAAASISCGARFEVVMAPRSEAAFATALVEDFGSLALKTCTVNVENAAAREAADLVNIRRTIVEDMGGFLEVNRVLVGAMREWMASVGRAALDAPPKDWAAKSALSDRLSRLLMDQGKPTEAEQLSRDAVAGCLQTLGETHLLTLASMTNLANVLDLVHQRVFHKSNEAFRLYSKVLNIKRKLLGDGHLSTLASIADLAGFFSSMGGPTAGMAVQLYTEAVAGYRKALGDAHGATLTSITRLAVALKMCGFFVAAEPLCREALAGCRAALGNEHPSTIFAMKHLADLLFRRGQGLIFFYPGRLAEAEFLHREVIALERKLYGDSHPETLDSVSNLALMLCGLRKFAQAEALLREALNGNRRVLGDEHPATLRSAENLIRAYKALRRFDAAAAVRPRIPATCWSLFFDCRGAIARQVVPVRS